MEKQDSFDEKTDHCLNCQAPFINTASFCPNCGQKNTDGRLTVKELFSQFFNNVFNLDSKIFRTLGSVLVPGKLTKAFLSGQRQKYYHPIRLFLVMIVICLAGLKYQSNIPLPTSLEDGRIDKLKERKRLMNVFDAARDSVKGKSNEQAADAKLDSLSNVFYRNSGDRVDSININKAVRIVNDYSNFSIALEDFGKYSSKEILEIYKVEGFYKRLLVQQKYKMIQSGKGFIPFVMGKVTWVVFFVLLLLSLIFKVLYFRTDFLYLEHLVFAIHLSSFFLIIASIFTFFSENTIGELLPWTLLVMATYLFIAMKRVYKQPYWITIPKFVLVVICCFFAFVFGLALTLVGSFLIF